MERITPERKTLNTASVSTASEIAFPHSTITSSTTKLLNADLGSTGNSIVHTLQSVRKGQKPKHKPLKSPPKVTEVVAPGASQTVMLEFQPDGAPTQEINRFQLDKAPQVVHQLLEISQAAGDGQVTTLTLSQEQAQEILGQLNRCVGTYAMPSSVNVSFMQADGSVVIDNSGKVETAICPTSSGVEVLQTHTYNTPTQEVNTADVVATETVTTEPVVTDINPLTHSAVHKSRSTGIPSHSTTTSSSSQPLQSSNVEPFKSPERTDNNKAPTSYLSPDIMQLLNQTNIPSTKN